MPDDNLTKKLTSSALTLTALSTAPDALLSSIILSVFGATPGTYGPPGPNPPVQLVGGSGSGALASIVIDK